MTDVQAMANAERQTLLGILQGLDDVQWATVTACDPWTIRDITAHLTALGNQTAPNFFLGMVKSRFSFDKFVAGDMVKYNQGTNAEVLAGFEKTVANPRTPPGPKYVSLGELMCHSEDIQRALGSRGEHPVEHVVTLADMYTKTGNPIGGKRRVAGLKLTATDADWTSGEGPAVSGPAIDLVLAMTGRADALDNCTGEGVDTLRARC